VARDCQNLYKLASEYVAKVIYLIDNKRKS